MVNSSRGPGRPLSAGQAHSVNRIRQCRYTAQFSLQSVLCALPPVSPVHFPACSCGSAPVPTRFPKRIKPALTFPKTRQTFLRNAFEWPGSGTPFAGCSKSAAPMVVGPVTHDFYSSACSSIMPLLQSVPRTTLLVEEHHTELRGVGHLNAFIMDIPWQNHATRCSKILPAILMRAVCYLLRRHPVKSHMHPQEISRHWAATGVSHHPASALYIPRVRCFRDGHHFLLILFRCREPV